MEPPIGDVGGETNGNSEEVTAECNHDKGSTCDPYTESTVFLDMENKNTMGQSVSYPDGAAAITNKLAVWEPGFETGIHKHPMPAVVTVWEGELTVYLVDKDKTITTKAGESYVSTPDVWHNSSNQGDETLKFSAVFLGNESQEVVIKKQD